MATGTRIRTNFVDGQLSEALSDTDTEMTSPGLTDLPTIGTSEYATISVGAEIVHVTEHGAGLSTATIERGQEGTTASSHSAGTVWVHGPTQRDFPVVLTESEYAAITPDPKTIYIVMEDPE